MLKNIKTAKFLYRKHRSFCIPFDYVVFILNKTNLNEDYCRLKKMNKTADKKTLKSLD